MIALPAVGAILTVAFAAFSLFCLCKALEAIFYWNTRGDLTHRIRRWFSRSRKGKNESKGDKLLIALRQAKCYFCDQQTLLGGPSGGACQNILCDSCGAKFNFGPPFFAEILRDPTDPIPETGKRASKVFGTFQQFPPEEKCSLCEDSRWIEVPTSATWLRPAGGTKKIRCPECYEVGDEAPPAKRSARRAAVEHTKNSRDVNDGLHS